MPKYIYLFVLFLFCNTILKAQTYYFDTYSVAEGLYQSKVFDVVQDNEHYIWIGTLGGVSRFDGLKFDNYTTLDGLATNGVQVVFAASDGSIWLGHLGGGVTRISRKKIEVVKLASLQEKSDIIDIEQDSLNRIWITSHGSGAFLINNPASPINMLKISQFKGNKLSDRVFKMCKTNRSLYFITDVGIKQLITQNNSFVNFHPKGLTSYFQVTTMFQDNKLNLWFGTYHGGLYKFDSEGKNLKIFDIRDGLASNWITDINQDTKGEIWVGSWGNGVTNISEQGCKIFNTQNGLPDNKIGCIYPDAEGNLLMGSNEHGLAIFKGMQFFTIAEKDGLGNPQVWAIIADNKNRLWFGTNNGITLYNPFKTGSQAFTYYNQGNKLISNQVRYFVADLNNTIWIGTNDQGVMTFDLEREKFVYQVYLNSLLPSNRVVTALAFDKNNTLWVGTVDGVIKYNIKNMEGQRLTNYNGLSGNDISSIYVDKENVVWVGAKSKGLTCIADTIITQYAIGEGVTPTAIAEDKKGNLWIGTLGQGLLVFNKSYVTKTFTETNGLLSNLINLVSIDSNENVYVGTNKGLNRFDAGDKKIYTFTRKNGFTGIETKPNAVCFDNMHNLWFGTVNGVIKYQRGFEKAHKLEPLTHITRLRVNLEDVNIAEGLKLNYKQNAIIFEYHSICLTNPEAVRYQVKLEGIDANWQPITEQTIASYPALPPHKYIFKVRARNSDGIWNTNPVTFMFEIKPPFYSTWWFIALCVFAGSILISVYIKRREQLLINEKRILEQKVTERTHEVTQKNDELGLANTELASKNKNITDSIRYAKRIQVAILPYEIPYPNTFIFFKPKDIVSGDFYWLLSENGLEFMAAVDCTGHGVPGAFMSIIGHILLNKIVKEYKIYQPSEILNALNNEIIEILHNRANETFSVNDGMDISIVCYNPQTKIITFAGAFNPIYIVRNSVLFEHAANRFSIGRLTGSDKQFTNNEIQVEENDMLYMFSDGYEDQFGGERGKKFKSQGMKELFVKVASRPIDFQKQIIEQTFNNWIGELEQIDDVMVLGRRF